jgi:curved DNA-binding protein CbpA
MASMKSIAWDPYTELGVDPAADQRTIRRAYLARARVHHPDLGGDVEVMARVNEAFELLGSPSRRAAHDAADAVRLGRAKAKAPPWTGAAGPPPGRPSGPVLDFGIFEGWSLGEVAKRDPGYLVWLSERREGRPYLDAIERHLAPDRESAETTPRRGGRR